MFNIQKKDIVNFQTFRHIVSKKKPIPPIFFNNSFVDDKFSRIPTVD